jgi:predicted dehydrogenase
MTTESRRAGVLSRAEVRRSAARQFSKTRKARLGFIGAGWWATTNHMPLLHARRDVEMVSVCGLDTVILERCQRDFGFRHVTTAYREVWKQDLDGVVISSPHRFHAEHGLAALKADCHVLVEKPFAIHARDARAMVSLAKRKRLHIVVPHGWHYRPIALKAKALMDKQPIGRIEFVQCHMAAALKNLFMGTSFDFKAGSYVEANLSTWADPRLAQGGFGHGQLSHSTALLFWLTGLRAESVSAKLSNASARVDLYEAINVRFAGGAIGAISGAATLPPGIAPMYQLDFRIFGEHGLVHIDFARCHLSLHTDRGRHETVPLKPTDNVLQCDGPPHQFVELILGLTTQNNSPGTIALRSVELLDAAYRSNRSGREESI